MAWPVRIAAFGDVTFGTILAEVTSATSTDELELICDALVKVLFYLVKPLDHDDIINTKRRPRD